MQYLRIFFITLAFTVGFGIQSAAAQEYSDGMLAYSSGDYDNAYQIWSQLANEGNVRAQFNVAYMYEFGIVSKPDYDKAIEWYRKAALQGYARAQNFLGWMYEMGKGVSRDRAEALKWLEMAADQGNEDAVADYKLVMKRYQRDQDKQFKATFMEFLQAELENAQNRYETNTQPAKVLLEASSHTG